MLSARLEIGEDRHAFADAGEVVERELYLASVGNRKQMQHGIGRAAQRNHHRDRVFKGALRHDVERANSLFEHFHHGSAGAAAILFLGVRYRVLRRAVGQAHAQRFDRAGHRIGGVHPAAGAWAGNRA